MARALHLLTGVMALKGSNGAGSEVGTRRRQPAGRSQMRYLKYVGYAAVLGILVLSMSAVASAQVRVGIGVGPVGVAIGAPPVCAYGYYPYAPYACAPYGYWGPDYFTNGVFIGAGPWFHGFYGHPYYGRGDWDHRGGWDRDGHGDNRFHGNEGFRGGARGGNEIHGGNNFHGGGAVRGGGGFHGGGSAGHGGGHR